MTRPDVFTQQDQRFLEGVAHWIGTVAHRAELLQRVASLAAQEARRATAEELVTVDPTYHHGTHFLLSLPINDMGE